MSFLSDVPASWKVLPRAFIGGVSLVQIPSSAAAPLLQVCEALHQTQFEAPEIIRLRQMAQARQLLHFARRHTAYYSAVLAHVDIDAACGSADAWRTLPLLARADIQSADKSILPDRLPVGHEVVGNIQTSGSTGQPVKARKTNVSGLFYRATAIREQVWHQRDITGKLASIRANAEQGSHAAWGSALSHLFQTGPYEALPFVDVAKQVAWLEEVRAKYLLTYPSNLQALLDASEDRGMTFDSLVEVRCIGETLSSELRRLCERQWSVKVSDLYSSEEVGNIACECPDGGRYHLMEENLIVEILRDDGEPCGPGEIGRVVVTDLHNFATPLIRYEIRDYAEVGEPCPCGRGLATLNRILGRHRNMLRTPEGEVRWPLTGFHNFEDVAAVRQYRFVQQELDLIEATLVVEERLSDAQRERLDGIIRKALQWTHRLVLVDQSEPLPVGANGKFEDFVSHV